MTEEEFNAGIYNLAATHFRSGAKAVLIGVMIFSAVVVFTGSIWKAFVIGLFCIVVSFFNTWRRYLEPIAFVLFCAGMAFWCFPEMLTGIKLAAWVRP